MSEWTRSVALERMEAMCLAPLMWAHTEEGFLCTLSVHLEICGVSRDAINEWLDEHGFYSVPGYKPLTHPVGQRLAALALALAREGRYS